MKEKKLTHQQRYELRKTRPKRKQFSVFLMPDDELVIGAIKNLTGKSGIELMRLLMSDFISNNPDLFEYLHKTE